MKSYIATGFAFVTIAFTAGQVQGEVLAKHYNRDQVWQLTNEICPESDKWKKGILSVPMLDQVQHMGACWATTTDDPNTVVMCRTANKKILSDCLYVGVNYLSRP
ncbi:hypothetical protein ACXM5X_29140 [Pseudomonas saponiphila]